MMSPIIGRALTQLQIMACRLKKNSLRFTHIFFDVIMDHSYKPNDNHMYLNKIYNSYVFFLKARTEDIFNNAGNLLIKIDGSRGYFFLKRA